MKTLKLILSGALLTPLFLALTPTAQAQEFKLGAHVGALGTTSPSDSTIAYGAHFLVNPFSIAGFQIDATFGRFNGATYFSTSPAVVVYVVDYSEFRLGLMGGPGFYKFPGDSTKFGLHIGAMGEFSLTDNFIVGMETRFHPVIGDNAPNVWNVFLTVGYRFEAGGGW